MNVYYHKWIKERLTNMHSAMMDKSMMGMLGDESKFLEKMKQGKNFLWVLCQSIRNESFMDLFIPLTRQSFDC